jgi:hypothetical protein
MDFIIQDVAKFVIQHCFSLLWGRDHEVNAAQWPGWGLTRAVFSLALLKLNSM